MLHRKLYLRVMMSALIQTCGFASVANASEAFFGVVGFRPGVGAAGHAFLLIKDQSTPFISSEFYQFNFKKENGQPILENDMNLDFRKMLFTLDHWKFAQVLSEYTDTDNRVVSVFGLNLSENEISNLKLLLEREEASNGMASVGSYSLLSNNCATRLIELLNKVVDSSKQINLARFLHSTVNANTGIVSGVRQALLNRVPFYLALTLEHHPISRGRIKTFERKATRQMKLYSTLNAETNLFAGECNLSATAAASIQSYLVLASSDLVRFPLKPIYDLALKACTNNSSHFLNMLLILYQLLPDRESAASQNFFADLSKFNLVSKESSK